MRNLLQFSGVSFAYPAQKPLFSNLSLSFGQGFTALAGANGLGKSSFLKLACGLLNPSDGSIALHGRAGYVSQSADKPPELDEAAWFSLDHSQQRLARRLHLQFEELARWPSLSFGERKRWQIAYALWQEYDALCLDEPTNHLDQESKLLLKQALSHYRGIALIASHDRMFLRDFARNTLLFTESGLFFRPLPLEEALEQQALEEQSARALYEKERKNAGRLKQSSQSLRQTSDTQSARNNKRHIDRKDHDAKGKVDAARLTGKDKIGSQKYKHLADRAQEASQKAQTLYIKQRHAAGVTLSAASARRDRLLFLPAGRLALGGSRFLRYPNLEIGPQARIALAGPNGSGKSALLNHIANALPLPPDKTVYVPQELSLNQRLAVLQRAQETPKERRGELFSAVHRLGSDAAALLESGKPSPGQARKLLIAFALLQQPYLIILDEPTNHLDLPSTLLLESALKQSAGALLLVSHDQAFADTLANRRWLIEKEPDGNSHLIVQP